MAIEGTGRRILVALLCAVALVLGLPGVSSAAGTPSVSINDVTVTEGTGGSTTASFTLTLSPPKGSVTVNYATANATATAPADYTAKSGTVTLSKTVKTATVSISVAADAIDEPNEAFYVNLSNPVGGLIADGQGIGTINDDDPVPSISVGDASVSEGAGSAAFTVSLSGASGRTVTVSYATADGTATQPGDYTAKSGTLSFSAGETSKAVTVTVVGDAIDEPDETFTMNLSGPTNATIADGLGLGTIGDDDPAPSLSIDDVSTPESDTGATATFTVSLSAPSGRTVSVNYATADGTASAPVDYTPASGALSFAPGETSKTVNVGIVGDSVSEPDDTFTVNLTSPTNATIGDDQGLGTIVNDDGAVTVSIGDVTVTEGNAGTSTASFAIALSGPRGVAVTVDYATADGTATQPSDYSSASGTVTIAPDVTSATVDVPIVGDTTDEPDETFVVDLSLPVEATVADGQGTGTIVDDDKTPTALTLRVRKTRTKVTASGQLEPAVAGMKVKVTLSRKKGAKYVRVASKTVSVKNLADRDADGKPDAVYSASFARPKPGAYRFVATFAGDANYAQSTATKSFKV